MVKPFTRESYQVESPSPIYKGRMQPRVVEEVVDEEEREYSNQTKLKRFAASKYEFAVMDIITGEWIRFDSIEHALAFAITEMGWNKDKAPETIHIRESETDEWVQLTSVFGNVDFSMITKDIEDWKPPKPSLRQEPASDWRKEGEEWKGSSYDPDEQGEEWKRYSILRGFSREAVPWTPNELNVLKSVYREARDRGIPHNKIYQRLSDFIPHSARGIKQKLEALYKQDEDLAGYKFESWSREKILEEICRLYSAGEPISRKALPAKLEYQITNHSLPKAITRGFEVFFDSFDYAIAEALLSIGCCRNELGELDQTRPLEDLQQAWRYYRYSEKKNNPWTKEEIIHLFQKAHEKGLPLTKSFFTSHPSVYKPLLEVSRSLDGLRKSIDRLGLTWGDLVIDAVPDYASWYSDEGKPRNSMGELRVIRFLDLHNIPYRTTGRKDKIPVTESEVLSAGYKNFIPDIFILDEAGNDIGLVEIYGAIADSGAASGELSQKYREKIEAKEQVYKTLPLVYIAIHDNELYGCDLSDDCLAEKFAAFISRFECSIDDN